MITTTTTTTTTKTNSGLLTATEIEILSKAVAIVSKQGFKAVSLNLITEKPFIYEVLCFYGDTDELYNLTVDAIRGTYVSSKRKN